MKKFLYIILSVMILVMSGCGNNQSKEVKKVKEIAEAESDTSIGKDDIKNITDEEFSLENETTSVISELPQNEQNTEENTELETEKQVEREEETVITPTSRQQIVEIQTTSTSGSRKEEVTNATTKVDDASDITVATEITTAEGVSTANTEATTEQESTEEETTSNLVIEYDPDRVCALATSICEQEGLRTTADSMDEMLANGLISKEEYDEFYPYAGAGYLGVFIETDLSTACTITGRRLSSEQAIAEYLAEVMISEATDEYFYIECAGIYVHHGVSMYEFRCYR